MLQSENWLPVRGYEGIYEISDHGNIRSLRFNKTKYLYKNNSRRGYIKVTLCKAGKRKDVSVHRLVAEAFITKTDISHNIVNHLDGDRSNNYWKNLEWTDQSGNVQHAWDIGLNTINENKLKAMRNNSYNSGKLSFDIAKEIRISYANKEMNIKELAAKYNIDRSVISRIIHNKAWVERFYE